MRTRKRRKKGKKEKKKDTNMLAGITSIAISNRIPDSCLSPTIASPRPAFTPNVI